MIQLSQVQGKKYTFILYLQMMFQKLKFLEKENALKYHFLLVADFFYSIKMSGLYKHFQPKQESVSIHLVIQKEVKRGEDKIVEPTKKEVLLFD